MLEVKKVLDLIKSPISYWMGMRYYQSKNWESAQKYFEQAIAKSPEHAHSQFKLGMCLLKQKRKQKAHEYFANAVRLLPSKDEWRVQFVQTGVSGSQGIDPEISVSQEIEYTPRKSVSYDKLAQTLENKKKWWQEVEVLKKLIELKGTQPNLQFRLGCALEKMNRFDEAAIAFESAISQSKKISDASWYYLLGNALSKTKNASDKITEINEAYKNAEIFDKKLNSKRFGIGVFHQDRGLWDEARDAYLHQVQHQTV